MAAISNAADHAPPPALADLAEGGLGHLHGALRAANLLHQELAAPSGATAARLRSLQEAYLRDTAALRRALVACYAAAAQAAPAAAPRADAAGSVDDAAMHDADGPTVPGPAPTAPAARTAPSWEDPAQRSRAEALHSEVARRSEVVKRLSDTLRALLDSLTLWGCYKRKLDLQHQAALR